MKSGAPQAALDIPKRWPLVSKLQTRTSSTPLYQDARLINCYAEFDPEDEEFWLYKRLGYGASLTGPGASGAPGWGMYTYFDQLNFTLNQAQVLSVWAGNSTLYSWSPTSLASTAINLLGANPTTQMAYFETVNSSPQTVVIQAGGQGYVYTPSTKTATQILTAGFPTGTYVPGWAYLDGTVYCMDTNGAIWNSAINQPLTWPGSQIQASSNADAGMFLIKQLNYIVALKQWTSQVFYDAGNTVGSPLAVVPDSQLAYGCFASGSVQQIDNTLLWMTSNQSVSPQVVRMDNLETRIVSTPAVERLLDEAAYNFAYPNGGIWSAVIKHAGHRFYILTIVSLNITLVYDLDQPQPANWYFWTDANGNFWPITAIAFTPAGSFQAGQGGLHLAQHTNGFIYPLDGAYKYPSDNGTLFPVDIYCPNFDGGTDRRKVLKMLYPNADRTAGSVLQVRFNDEDYARSRWSNFRSVDLSTEKPRLPDLGTFYKRRALHLRHQCNTDFRIKSLDLQLLWGSH